MNNLEQAIHNALTSEGKTPEANKAYLEFIKANFIIPVEKATSDDNPKVLYFSSTDHTFLPVFTNMTVLDAWAADIRESIQVLHLSGVNLLHGIGEHVTVSLNLGSPLHKEFNTAELARMRSMILKLGLVKDRT
ncbi:MAG: Fe-S center protein [Legionellales bacterium RIFCSPHIGHO2_12_FULL_42_9]|nr:MAG: Fe-S center protein [Legionellales bacterium RIFCSPHIGHO2_12_FULL_42_9]